MNKSTELILHCGQLQGNPSSNLKAPIVWLEHERAVVFQESSDLNFKLGPIHTISWASSLDFLPHLLELTCNVSGIDPAGFTVSPAFHFEEGMRVARPGVGIFPNGDTNIPGEVRIEMDRALTAFCRRVLKDQEVVGQQEFFPVEISAKTAEIVASLTDNFLASFGGKKVGEPRLLRTKSCEILIKGAYIQKNDVSLPDPETWTIVGEIDGLRGMTRTVYVYTEDRKTLAILFDEESFKEPLRSRVLDGLRYEFDITTEWISPGKKIDSLVSIRPCDGGDLILLSRRSDSITAMDLRPGHCSARCRQAS